MRQATEIGKGRGRFLAARSQARKQQQLEVAVRRYEKAEKMERRAAYRQEQTALRVNLATDRHARAAAAWQNRDRDLYAAAEALRIARRMEP